MGNRPTRCQRRNSRTASDAPAFEASRVKFNSSLDGNVRRAIDIREDDKIDEKALKALVRAAVALNLEGKAKPAARRASGKRADR